jgi:transposase
MQASFTQQLAVIEQENELVILTQLNKPLPKARYVIVTGTNPMLYSQGFDGEIIPLTLTKKKHPKIISLLSKINNQSNDKKLAMLKHELATINHRTAEKEKARKKVLNSVKNHWNGLIVFKDRPEVPMDNNAAERAIRPAVIGRKNYFGSVTKWSALLTAILFSIFQTLELWQINPRTWLFAYLDACRKNNGQPPEKLIDFIPWEMSPEQFEKLKNPPDD